MLTDPSIQAMLTANLPPGVRWFLVAALPLNDPQSTSLRYRLDIIPPTEATGSTDQTEALKLAGFSKLLQKSS